MGVWTIQFVTFWSNANAHTTHDRRTSPVHTIQIVISAFIGLWEVRQPAPHADLTQAEARLFFAICDNHRSGFFMAGDTCQTVSKGIDFRFCDLPCP